MAIYGISLYGTTTYGPEKDPGYGNARFTQVLTSYDSVELEWIPPGGQWSALRLVRSQWGIPKIVEDGDTLEEWTGSAGSFRDVAVAPGRFYYYSLFVYDGVRWARVASASVLTVRDHGYLERLPSLLPIHMQRSQETIQSLTEGTVANDALARFLNVFAYGMDLLHTQYDAMLDVNDPAKVSEWLLPALVEQMGVTYLSWNSSRNIRQQVLGAADNGRRKGTQGGFREVVQDTVGWDLEWEDATNWALNDDQARFLSVKPDVPTWASSIVYQPGDFVKTTTGPTGNPSYWYWAMSKPTTDSQVVAQPALKDLSGDLSTVKVGGYKGFWRNSQFAPVRGFSSYWKRGVADPTTYTAAANTIVTEDLPEGLDGHGAASTPMTSSNGWRATLMSALPSDTDPSVIVKQGIPLPQQETGQPWLFSVFGKISSISGGPSISPVVNLYDAKGALLASVSGAADLQEYDADVSETDSSYTTRSFWQGTQVWTASGGAWSTTQDVDGMAMGPTTAVGKRFLLTPAPSTSFLKVAVTVLADRANSQGIVLRYIDSSNYLKVSRSSVTSVVAGVSTVLGTFDTAPDGSRLSALYNGDTIQAFVNGKMVFNGTTADNNTGTKVGLIVE